MKQLFLTPIIFLAACSSATDPAPEALYFERLSGLCNGEAYAGKLVSDDAVDADFKTANMIMGPATCDGLTVRIPFAVDEDRSRTWVITRTQDGLRLKHDHRHEDGSEDALTQYGGDSTPGGTAGQQDYPVDEETRTLFIAQEIEVSTQNTWTVEIEPGEIFAYQMSRPERLFRVEFDLTMPVDAPPPPWGVAPIAE
ncbi:MAG: hypothetical protein K0U61_06790 [Alphaproteobacteria bacterium]|nr:hypothetical protein [Henriciella sp.]MBO6695056.1 hypothetical protein [Henriciella sp.]MCH9751908.1 hypothetical protein [Alphaproteobacteria bacterium]